LILEDYARVPNLYEFDEWISPLNRWICDALPPAFYEYDTVDVTPFTTDDTGTKIVFIITLVLAI
jgi:hypothetical protein